MCGNAIGRFKKRRPSAWRAVRFVPVSSRGVCRLPINSASKAAPYIFIFIYGRALYSSGCFAVPDPDPIRRPIGCLRSSPLDHLFSLMSYCVSVFLRAVFRSIKLCACEYECVVPSSLHRATTVKLRVFVPVMHSGYRTVCTPSPHTVFAPRERSRRFTLQILIAILVISCVLHA
ncbi:hypothetical protein EVAR_58829_1 [Eumeta japonica]|uniref:Uncharacterized protein n=1 Tax=Eumeta variegata TaxID=151549 RepID=A0A4C1YHU0_EUMVA|nr:hypothetical protein EVAR_58829_1 [Eumeta japonica]